MDCVGCDKCRLWGKLQITGLGTALKLLFSYEQSTSTAINEPILSRGEVVSFINTIHRLSESLAAVEKFRELWSERNTKEKKKVVEMAKEEEKAEDQVEGIPEIEGMTVPEEGSRTLTKEGDGDNVTMTEVVGKGMLAKIKELCVGGWKSCWSLSKATVGAITDDL